MEKQHIVGEFGYFQKGKGHLTPITNSSTATQCLHTLRHPLIQHKTAPFASRQTKGTRSTYRITDIYYTHDY